MATLLRTDGTCQTWTDLTLEGLHTAVGGYIEVVYTHTHQQMVINEEGKINGLPLNSAATLLYVHGWHDVIVGNAVVMDEGEELE